MAKRLQDMTLEELWRLFPIVLVPHNHEWKDWADMEIESLRGMLSALHPDIHHIGSTSIPGIKAKPIVDILVQLPAHSDWSAVKDLMESNGYICMSTTEGRISFNKGYTPEGYAERVFHIHIDRTGGNDEILFRDCLLAHPEDARAYERLKLRLLEIYRKDRDGYTCAKTDFITGILAKAKGLKE